MKDGSDIQVVWEVEDGYCGGGRPQHTSISLEEIGDCNSEDDVLQLMADCVQSDFDDRISPGWDERQSAKVVEAWRELQLPKKKRRHKQS